MVLSANCDKVSSTVGMQKGNSQLNIYLQCTLSKKPSENLRTGHDWSFDGREALRVSFCTDGFVVPNAHNGFKLWEPLDEKPRGGKKVHPCILARLTSQEVHKVQPDIESRKVENPLRLPREGYTKQPIHDLDADGLVCYRHCTKPESLHRAAAACYVRQC